MYFILPHSWLPPLGSPANRACGKSLYNAFYWRGQIREITVSKTEK